MSKERNALLRALEECPHALKCPGGPKGGVCNCWRGQANEAVVAESGYTRTHDVVPVVMWHEEMTGADEEFEGLLKARIYVAEHTMRNIRDLLLKGAWPP